MANDTGEIMYTGEVWKVSSLKDGGYRVVADLSTTDFPMLRVGDLVAVALLKPDSDKPPVF